jgi:glycosyltransferase involved in cell wall biosynthesis
MSEPGADGETKRRLLLDLTLTYRSIGHIPNGIIRAERDFARAALQNNAVRVDFCHYDKRTGHFYTVRQQDIELITTYLCPSRCRRLAGRRSSLRDVWEFVTSHATRRYRFMRWNPRRFLPVGALSLRLNKAKLDSSTVYVLVHIDGEEGHLAAIAAMKRATGTSVYFLCHDIIPIIHPEYFEPSEVALFRRYIETMMPLADGIGAVSKATRRDIETFAQSMGMTPPPISVVALGTGIVQEPPPGRPAVLPAIEPRDFVLCVGNINIRKNHVLLYRLWARLSEQRLRRLPPLVVVGAVGWLVDDVLERMRSDPWTCDSIILLHDVDDRSLAWLYAHCLFTVYPSLYEGWGLPVSESLAHGKYCIASASSALPEAGAGFSAHLDPDDLDAWADAVAALLDDPDLLDRKETDIRARHRPITWRESADVFFAQVLADVSSPTAAHSAKDQ